MLAADQEGGLVQRLKGPGFSTIPSAQDQAELSDRTLRKRAARWGSNSPPPGSTPIWPRWPMSSPPVSAGATSRSALCGAATAVNRRPWAKKVTAFTRGMADADVITATKHFPGLGRVIGNTDFVAKVTDTKTRRRDPVLAGFQAAVDADVDMVMVSSAYYSRIDPKRRAAFSRKIITTMLRGDLGFEGVVISDDLSAAAMRDLSPGQRAVRFVGAGGDLAIVGDPDEAAAMATALRREAGDPAFRRQIATSATRVITMKAAHGLRPADIGDRSCGVRSRVRSRIPTPLVQGRAGEVEDGDVVGGGSGLGQIGGDLADHRDELEAVAGEADGDHDLRACRAGRRGRRCRQGWRCRGRSAARITRPVR